MVVMQWLLLDMYTKAQLKAIKENHTFMQNNVTKVSQNLKCPFSHKT